MAVSNRFLGFMFATAFAIGCSSNDVFNATEADDIADEDSDGGDAASDSGGEKGESGPGFEDDGEQDDGGKGADPCAPALPAIVRDFTADHPDFERYEGSNAYKGIVEAELGQDGKPVYAHSGATPVTTGPSEFAQWYTDVPGTNIAIPISLDLEETSPGVFVYENSKFFPIDGQGFGNGPPVRGESVHNFLFTTEFHTVFTYEGGEVFSFAGDDDLWVFVNGKLAMDLGGVHPEVSASIEMDARADELGLEKGKSYAMDIFHAERHTSESNFRIETTIKCFQPPVVK